MNKREKLVIDQMVNGENYYYRSISVDNVIFGYHNRELKILLLKPLGMQRWLLPGGYVLKKETLDSAAKRIVRYRTMLKDIKLFQFKCFSDPQRNKDTYFTTSVLSEMAQSLNVKIDNTHWLLDDFISVGYFALTEFSLVKPRGDFYAEECQWWEVNSLPEMSFDHADIIREALLSLKMFTYHYPIGKELLPEKFTIPELQSLYETILNKKIDNRNFTKKMVSIGLVVKTNEKKKIGGHRSPFLYKFDNERYKEIISNGEVLIF